MDLKAGLFQQQSLKLAMTQELSQAIALLQYSTQELVSFLDSKAAENPLISVEHGEAYSQIGRKRKNTQQSDAKYWIEQIGEEKVSLEEYLFSQLPPNYLSQHEKKLFQHLIYNLDDNGYLRMSTEEIAQHLNESEEDVNNLLTIMQALEPAGVGARNLQECLLLQLKRKENIPYTYEIISNHFLLFADKKWKQIAKELSISMKEIQNVSDYIQSLEPRPCSRFSIEKPSFIVPDVKVDFVDGQILVRMKAESNSKVTFNQTYYTELSGIKDKQVSTFLQEKNQEYQWIIKSIEQRRETILRVMTTIAQKQPECMRKGFAHLKPMTMREIAEKLNIHESTVSRTVRGKYVQAPFGTVEMREFFSSSLQSTNSEDVSAQEAKNEMQILIHNEDKKKPLSDQDISDILKAQKKIVLSRRTVAKYRDQLNIPSSSKRKRF